MEADPETFLFCALVSKDGTWKLNLSGKSMTYKAARLELKHFSSLIGINKDYTWHSFRHGGASQAAAGGVPDRLFKKHGRWRSEKAKDGYVHESVEELLSVSQTLKL